MAAETGKEVKYTASIGETNRESHLVEFFQHQQGPSDL